MKENVTFIRQQPYCTVLYIEYMKIKADKGLIDSHTNRFTQLVCHLP